MIKIKIKYIDQKFASLKVSGHANSDEYGKDLVCAAVSATLTGGFNALRNPKDFKIILEEGNALLEANKIISDHDEVVIETIVTGLKSIEENDPKFVKVIYE